MCSRTHLSLHCPGSCLEIHDATRNNTAWCCARWHTWIMWKPWGILQHCPSFIPPGQFCVVHPASQHHSGVIMKSAGATTLFSEPFRGLSSALMESDTLKAVHWILSAEAFPAAHWHLFWNAVQVLRRDQHSDRLKNKCRWFSGLLFIVSSLNSFWQKTSVLPVTLDKI